MVAYYWLANYLAALMSFNRHIEYQCRIFFLFLCKLWTDWMLQTMNAAGIDSILMMNPFNVFLHKK